MEHGRNLGIKGNGEREQNCVKERQASEQVKLAYREKKIKGGAGVGVGLDVRK